MQGSSQCEKEPIASSTEFVERNETAKSSGDLEAQEAFVHRSNDEKTESTNDRRASIDAPSRLRTVQPEILMVEWDGPDDPYNPRKSMQFASCSKQFFLTNDKTVGRPENVG